MSDGRKSTTANIDHKDYSSSSSLSRANKTLDTFNSLTFHVSNSSALGIAHSHKVTMSTCLCIPYQDHFFRTLSYCAPSAAAR
ncbi:hypothetical protein CEXT_645001 [Caerostris extrusa]|uniref:Uncharacterized protein n=1 Tax=Caerostris extrusa TaxID=172846 RepID=A0AAV4TAB0_CAEEX|nr:hypothetical protein CEXT_645001 [Caerostris extrusa]